MSDKNPSSNSGIESMSATARESFETMSNAFSGWLRNANNMQAETIRFMNERFNKDMQMLSRFSTCKKPEDFLNLQSELFTQLVSDYMEEGAKIMALFGNMAKTAVNEARPNRR